MPRPALVDAEGRRLIRQLEAERDSARGMLLCGALLYLAGTVAGGEIVRKTKLAAYDSAVEHMHEMQRKQHALQVAWDEVDTLEDIVAAANSQKKMGGKEDGPGRG